MKAFIFLVTLFSISLSAFANGDTGWSSSGGGEYIINQNNPWFLGRKPVKWCIDHGGSDKFSLSFDLAKIEISNAINILTSQLKSINRNNGDFVFNNGTSKISRKNCVETFGSCEYMTDSFQFTPNCSDADLEFILGNYNNEKIQKLISNLGIEKFKNLAGIAIRTEYSEETLRGKGFVYIAADKGDIQYSGSRNIDFKSNTIWDYFEKIDKDAPFPRNIASNFKAPNLINNLKIKDYSMGALQPIATHELGHVLGFGHNHSGNVMDEDYPSNIIKSGLAFKGNFVRESMILSRGLIESDPLRRIGFEWDFNSIQAVSKNNMEKDNPAIYNFLFNIQPKNILGNNNNMFFIFNGINQDFANELKIATLDTQKLEYIMLKSFRVDINPNCSTHNQIEAINFRSEESDKLTNELEYDSNSKQWNYSKSSRFKEVTTTPLLILDNNKFCGKIALTLDSPETKRKDIFFNLYFNYFNNKSYIELLDPEINIPVVILLKDSDIFEKIKSENDIFLPHPIPVINLLK